MNFELKTKINGQLVKEADKLIKDAQKILLVGHKNPDGDTIGCLTAMVAYLKSINKSYAAFSANELPVNLEYLKHSQEIGSDKNIFNHSFDLVICLDTADLKYSGVENELNRLKARGVKIVNIDHHPSNYGAINIVDDQASSTSVILYDILRIWQVVINKDMATSLLAGILVDTMNFMNSATNDKSLGLSAELLQRGAKFNIISRQLYQTKTQDGLKLWSRLLKRLKKNDTLNIAYSVILAEDIGEAGTEETEGMSNFLSNLAEARLSMVIKEIKDGEIRVSMRAIDEQVDVAEMARHFGGGGHKKAAGFTIKGRLEQEGEGGRIV